MRRALILLLGLAACQPQTINPNWQYRQTAYQPPLTLSYAAGRIDPPAAQAAKLRALGAMLPQTVVPVLYGASPLDRARALAIGRLLDRPVLLARLSELGPNTALLSAPMPRVIVSDACRGPGQATPGGIWPGDDATAPTLLPAGCAVESDVAAQVTEPRDLLAGRPLPPGAALPYATAIERYYDSFSGAPAAEGGVSGGVAGGGGGGTSTNEPAGQAPANPLLGPLPGPPTAGAEAR